MTGHHVRVGHAVRPVLGVPGPKDRILVLVLRQSGKGVTKLDPGDVGRDRAELAPDLLRCSGLGVEAINVADTALQPNQNARHVLAGGAACAGTSFQEARKGQPESRQRANPQ